MWLPTLMRPALVVVDLLLISNFYSMDFQFNNLYGNVFCRCSMGHEAFARWLNTELPLVPDLAPRIVQAIQTLQQNPNAKPVHFAGREFHLTLDQQDAYVQPHGAYALDEQFTEQDLHLYEDESHACCGLDDFQHFFQSYLDFLNAR